MIKARHAKWADRIFYPYVMGLFKRHFHAIHLLGEVPETNPELPLLLLPNHSTWWDGFFVYLLNRKLFARLPYLMMLEEQLARYRFFARLGAFSINPHSAGSVRESIRYSIEILKQQLTPKPLLCIFPQGDLWPWDKRPLEFKGGTEVILNGYAGRVNLLPLAIRTEFLGEQRPEAFFLFGQNTITNSNTFLGMQRLQEIEENLLDQLRDRITKGEQGITLVSGRKSINQKFDAVRGLGKTEAESHVDHPAP
ncbi:MAG: lysophospholipid acyltransferase family protein [candidate division KSB1 bacterium]|nr:lysophospholipid acyltransferase family protein [candidate division KSB1 bacterium]MDZ7304014.1 lysophospholipid acyltransferase family protein [candidate division KSB1 bacterium]MDZ7313276.1 lysophospholipid acyltransferase family protein [candidate division KSB1 bacterium]